MKERKRRLNVRLLRRIQKQILEEPKRLNMLDWAKPEMDRPDKAMPKCGTVGCIAGWACHLSHRRPITAAGFARIGAELLGLPTPRDYWDFLDNRRKESPTSDLFLINAWPVQFKKRYANIEFHYTNAGFKKKAQITSSRIDFFIKTGE